MIRETPWRASGLIRAAPIDELAAASGVNWLDHLERLEENDGLARLQRSINRGRMRHIDPIFRSTKGSHTLELLKGGGSWCGYVVAVPTGTPQDLTPVGAFHS